MYVCIYVYIYTYLHDLEKEMATHYSNLAWRIPWTEEPGRLQPMGLQRVRHDWATVTHIHTHACRRGVMVGGIQGGLPGGDNELNSKA